MTQHLSRLVLALIILFGNPALATAPESELAQDLRAFVAASAGVLPNTIALPALSDFEGEAAASGIESRFSVHPREDFQGLTPVTIALRKNGQEIRRGAVSVRVGPQASVLVATRSIPKETILTSQDVTPRPITGRAPAGSVAEIHALLGKKTTRAVSAGAVWREHHVRFVPAIERGQSVRLRLEQGPLWIEGIGRAREEGRTGDSIRVLNLTSRREVRGTITSEGIVRVDY